MQKLWLPATLYRALPLLYLLAGSCMLALFGNDALGRISGLLLLAAGLLIGALRLVARRDASSGSR